MTSMSRNVLSSDCASGFVDHGGPCHQVSSPIYEGSDRLVKSLEAMSALVDQIESRIQGVLGPEPPSNESGVAGPQGPMSPIAENLHGYAGRVEFLVDRLRRICSRVEL